MSQKKFLVNFVSDAYFCDTMVIELPARKSEKKKMILINGFHVLAPVRNKTGNLKGRSKKILTGSSERMGSHPRICVRINQF